MLQRRMRRALAASSLTAVLALAAPIQGEAASFKAGVSAPDLWTAAIQWLGSWWGEVRDKQGSGIDPDGREGGSGNSPNGSSTQTVDPPIQPDEGSGIDPNG